MSKLPHRERFDAAPGRRLTEAELEVRRSRILPQKYQAADPYRPLTEPRALRVPFCESTYVRGVLAVAKGVTETEVKKG